MPPIQRHPLIDEVLDEWAPRLGLARAGYGGHAQRIYNLARQLLGSERHDTELALASAFHDLGIWSDDTFDYIEPSVQRALEHIRLRRLALSEELVAELIAQHHRLRRVRSGLAPEVVDAFRRADLVDVVAGGWRAGVDPAFTKDLVAVFPYAGFHGTLLQTALRWILRHPLRPLPMLRW
jgi:hypothetical protein